MKRPKTYVYELSHPTDHTVNGRIHSFRETSQVDADFKARQIAAREGATVRRKAIL